MLRLGGALITAHLGFDRGKRFGHFLVDLLLRDAIFDFAFDFFPRIVFDWASWSFRSCCGVGRFFVALLAGLRVRRRICGLSFRGLCIGLSIRGRRGRRLAVGLGIL